MILAALFKCKHLLFSRALRAFWNLSGGSTSYRREQGGPEGMSDGVVESNWNENISNFDNMNLKESLLRGNYADGFEMPSATQQRAVIPCI